jgi:hypothetical protein
MAGLSTYVPQVIRSSTYEWRYRFGGLRRASREMICHSLAVTSIPCVQLAQSEMHLLNPIRQQTRSSSQYSDLNLMAKVLLKYSARREQWRELD